MRHDRLDTRLLAESSARGGTMIDNPGEVGGRPSLPATVPPKDTDGDGLPDDPWDNLNPGMKTDARTAILDDDHDSPKEEFAELRNQKMRACNSS